VALTELGGVQKSHYVVPRFRHLTLETKSFPKTGPAPLAWGPPFSRGEKNIGCNQEGIAGTETNY